MNRKHTIEEYLSTFNKLKDINPKIQFSSDFIIGYPGEEDQDFKDTFKLKYQNIPLKKTTFQSQSKIYVNEYIKLESKEDSDLIEIHNRPNYFHLIFKKKIKQKIILYFHNDHRYI